MTKMPNEIDSPESLLPDLIKLRNKALSQGDFKYTVHLSHVHVWLYWISQNFEELKRK